jgi:hypothetical protein
MENQEPITARSVLTCDVCRGAIDDVRAASVCWHTADKSNAVASMALVHERCDASCLYLSIDLESLADPMASLRWLADVLVSYKWGAPQLRRLVLIAWATTIVGANERQRSAEWHKRRLEMGL